MIEAQPSFSTLWWWLQDEIRIAKREAPARIHAQSGDRDDWGQARESIRGLPFTRSFELYIDGKVSGPLAAALHGLRPLNDRSLPADRHRFQKSMFKVTCLIVVDGLTDQDEVQRRSGLAPFAFRVAATSGILALRSLMSRTT